MPILGLQNRSSWGWGDTVSKPQDLVHSVDMIYIYTCPWNWTWGKLFSGSSSTLMVQEPSPLLFFWTWEGEERTTCHPESQKQRVIDESRQTRKSITKKLTRHLKRGQPMAKTIQKEKAKSSSKTHPFLKGHLLKLLVFRGGGVSIAKKKNAQIHFLHQLTESFKGFSLFFPWGKLFHTHGGFTAIFFCS